MVAVACSSGSASTTTTEATDTTKPQIILGGLTEADPATLIPLENAEPIVVGQSHAGVVSADGSKVAIQSDLSDGRILISTFEVAPFALLSSIEVESEPQMLTITNDGDAYWFSQSAGAELLLLTPDTDDAYFLAERLPDGFTPIADEMALLGGNTLGMFGSYPAEDGTQVATVAIVTPGGVTTTHDLLGVETQKATPAAVWDIANDRVLVVAATEDIVFELSLSGAIAEHPWDGQGPSVGREAVLSPDGNRLYIASASAESENGAAPGSSQNLIVLDPVTWARGEVVDVVVDRLWPSPDGVTLLARGAEAAEPTGPPLVYLIEMTTAQVQVGLQTNGAAIDAVQFSADSSLAYLISQDVAGERVDILELDAQGLTGAMTFGKLSLIGRAGLVAFHQ